MKPKTTAIVSYLTWIGWIVAMVKRDKTNAFVTRHINQALIINLAEVVAGWFTARSGVLGIVGEVMDVAVFVFWIMGIVRAAKESAEPLPVIGEIELIH